MATAADNSSNPIDQILSAEAEDENDTSISDRIKKYIPGGTVNFLAGLDGQLGRYYSRVDLNPFSDPEVKTNAELAATFATTANKHNETFRTKINNLTTPSTNYDTHEVTFETEGTDPASVYVVGAIENETVTLLNVLSAAEFNETGRSVDEYWAVDGDAARNAGELTTSLAERIESGDPLDKAYQARLAGRYCSVGNPFGNRLADPANCDVRSTLWMDKEDL